MHTHCCICCLCSPHHLSAALFCLMTSLHKPVGLLQQFSLPCSFVAASQQPSLCHALRMGRTASSSLQQASGTVLLDSISTLLLNQSVPSSPAWLSYAQHCKDHRTQKLIVFIDSWEKKTRHQTALPGLCSRGLLSHTYAKHLANKCLTANS